MEPAIQAHGFELDIDGILFKVIFYLLLNWLITKRNDESVGNDIDGNGSLCSNKIRRWTLTHHIRCALSFRHFDSDYLTMFSEI